MVSAWERALARGEGSAAPVRRKYQDLTPAGRAELRRSVARKNLTPLPQPKPSTQQSAPQRSRWALPTGTPLVTPSGQTPTPQDYAVAGQFAVEAALGSERESVLPGTQQAGALERFVRTQAGEEEFRLAGQRASEGRLGTAAGWGLLGLAGAVPFFGDIAQGAAGVSRAAGAAGDVARGAGRAADVARTAEQAADVARGAGRAADVGRAAENRWADAWRKTDVGQDWRAPDISSNVDREIGENSLEFTIPQERLASIGEQRRPTAEVFHRQQFDVEPQRIESRFFYPAVDASNGTPIYRGLSAATEDEAARYAEQFLSGEYYIGGGFNGTGSYFGTDPRTALEYASMMSRDFPQGRPGAIVRAVIPGSAKIFDDSLDSVLTRSIMRSFSRSNFDDLGMYLASLGYDGQRVRRLGEEYIVMYNRGILKADESVYKVPAGLKQQKDEGGWEGMNQILRNLYGEDFVR